jgi:mannose-6-phosphate isomerase
MSPLYPFRFVPVFKRYLWGGRRLGTVLGKPIGPEEDYAESWEVSDHPSGQSVVAAGPLAGTTLQQLLAAEGRALGGDQPLERFPLLFKFLDCQRVLSVQVHPNDEQGAKLQPPDLGKTEAWIVLDAQPGALVYAGLKRGFDRDALAREVNRGCAELCLHSFEPQAGDCIFIPAGTVHALGAGLLVAEIQQASDTTYRLYDWNRVGPDGKPRPLHVKESLDTINYTAGPVSPQRPQSTGQPHAERLVACSKFVLDRWKFDKPQTLADDGRFHLLAVLSGAVAVPGDAAGRALQRGETILIPAAWRERTLSPQGEAVMLDIALP